MPGNGKRPKPSPRSREGCGIDQAFENANPGKHAKEFLQNYVENISTKGVAAYRLKKTGIIINVGGKEVKMDHQVITLKPPTGIMKSFASSSA